MNFRKICSRKQLPALFLILGMGLLLSACGVGNESATAIAYQDAQTEIAGDDETTGLISAMVARVVDGDTIEVSLDGTIEKIRMIGVDTPESVHPDAERNVPYGEISSAFTQEMLLDKRIELEFDVEERDRYGRLLAYVYLDGEMYNKTLLDEGHAMIATYPPNVKYVDLFTEAQAAAREAGKGVWAYDAGAPSSADTDQGSSDTQNNGRSASSSDRQSANYIGTTNSYKFHTMDCEWGQKIAEHNAAYFDTRDSAVAAGFVPCKVCNP